MFNCIFELLELFRVCQVIVFFLSSRNRKPLSEAETFIGNKSIFFNLFIRKEELDKLNERESVYLFRIRKKQNAGISLSGADIRIL